MKQALFAIVLFLVGTSLAFAPGTLPESKLTAHIGAVWSLGFSPDGRILASGGKDGLLTLWDLKAGKPAWRSAALGGEINSVAFAPDGKRVAAGSDDGRIRLWNVRKAKPDKTLEGHTGAVSTVAYSPDGKTLASGSYDKTTRIWDGRKGKPAATLEAAAGEVWSLAFVSGGKRLAVGAADGSLRFWNVQDRKKPRALPSANPQEGAVWALTASRQEPWMASGLWTGGFTVWANQSDETAPFPLLSSDSLGPQIWAMTLAPGGSRLAISSGSLGKEGFLEIWDVLQGGQLWSLKTESMATALAFSPDGQWLAAGLESGVIDLWKLELLPLGKPMPVPGALLSIQPTGPPPPLYTGIGVTFTQTEGKTRIETVLAESPAAAQGLKPGDLLLTLDGKSVEGQPLEQIVEQARGPSETTLNLTVSRAKETLTVALVRSVILVPSPTPKP